MPLDPRKAHSAKPPPFSIPGSALHTYIKLHDKHNTANSFYTLLWNILVYIAPWGLIVLSPMWQPI